LECFAIDATSGFFFHKKINKKKTTSAAAGLFKTLNLNLSGVINSMVE